MISKIKNKVKFVLSDEKAYINTPTVLVGMLILVFIVLIFTDAVVVSSQGFQARQAAQTIAKQISVAGEVNEDTKKLAQKVLNEMVQDGYHYSDSNEDNPKIKIIMCQITNSDGEEIQNFGCAIGGEPGGAVTEMFELDNKTTEKNGKTIPMYKFQLGDTAEVTVGILYLGNLSPTGVIQGNLFGEHTSSMEAKSTAVSQIYWKELDV